VWSCISGTWILVQNNCSGACSPPAYCAALPPWPTCSGTYRYVAGTCECT
jgi:hypothetical protein